MSTEPDYGTITFEDDTIKYESSVFGSWEFGIEDVAVIGTYTTPEGPSWPDYYAVFVLTNGKWHDVPVDAAGFFDVSGRILERIGSTWSARLAGSTELASDIFWPAQLAGRPLFVFTSEKRGLLDRIVRFWRLTRADVRLTDEVLEYLQSSGE